MNNVRIGEGLGWDEMDGWMDECLFGPIRIQGGMRERLEENERAVCNNTMPVTIGSSMW